MKYLLTFLKFIGIFILVFSVATTIFFIRERYVEEDNKNISVAKSKYEVFEQEIDGRRFYVFVSDKGGIFAVRRN